MKKNRTVKIVFGMAILMGLLFKTTPVYAVDAKSTPSSVYIDFDIMLSEAYQINENLFYKMDDVACFLSERGRKIKVDISDTKVTITNKQAQTKNDDTFCGSNFKTYSAKEASVTLDGAARTEKVYIINGKACAQLQDIGVLFNMAVSDSNTLRDKFYTDIDNPANVPESEKGRITSDWKDGIYAIVLKYAPEYALTISYGSVKEDASLVLGKYLEDTPEKQLFIIRKVPNSKNLYTFENLGSRMIMATETYTHKSEKVFQTIIAQNTRGLREFTVKTDNMGTKISFTMPIIDSKYYWGTTDNKKTNGKPIMTVSKQSANGLNFYFIRK